MGFLPEWLWDAFSLAATIDVGVLALVIAIYLASVGVYAARLYLILRRLGIRCSYFDCVIAYMISILVNNVTPAAKAGGEFARVAYISSRAGLQSTALLINAVAYERVTEAIAVALLALYAVLTGIASNMRPLWGLALVTVAGLVVVERYWDRLLEVAARRLPQRYSDMLGLVEAARGMQMRRLLRDRVLLPVAVTLSLLVWVMDAARIRLIALGLGYSLSLDAAIVVSLLYLAVGLVAVTPGGLGIVEGGLAAALASMGIPLSGAVAVTLIERLISYGLGTALGLLALLSTGGRGAWRRLRSRWYLTGSAQK